MAFARWRTTVTDLKGNVVPNAAIYVVNESNGSVPQLYSDRNGSATLGNPFNADGEGFAYFHALGGAYRITATAGGFQREWRYVGIGTAQELDAGAFGENAGWDAVVDDVAGRAAYNSEAIGFRVLVIDADGNGRAAVFEKAAAGAVWSYPIWITGVQGADAPPNTLTIGTVTQTPTPEVEITGTSPNQVLNFGLVKGDTGDVTPEMIQLRDEAEDARDAAAGSASAADAAGTGAESARDAAVVAQTAAEAAQAGAAQDAADATAAAAAAAISETNAAASEDAAAGSASAAATSATTAGTQAGIAIGAASAASTSSASAASSANAAATSETNAGASATNAADAQEYAWEWSSNAEDDPVDDGIRQGFSAYHWSKKAEVSAGGGIQSVVEGDGISVDNADLLNPIVGLDAVSQSSLAKAESAVQSGTLATVATTGSYSDLTGTPVIPQGTVTSVGLVTPTGFDNTGAITTSGNITISYASGYQGYTTAEASKLSGIEAGAQVNPGVGTTAGTVAAGNDARIVGAVQKAGDNGLGGFQSAEHDHGDLPASFTPTLANGNFQRGNKNAAKIINAPAAGAYSMQITVTNTSGTGGLTASGFDKVNGEFRADNGEKHILLINMSASAKVLTIVEAS